MARRTKLSRTVIDDFASAIGIGATYEVAAEYAGFSERSIYGWLKIGEEEEQRLLDDRDAKPDPDKTLHLHFLRTVREAKGNAAITWLEVVNRSAVSDPTWALRMLAVRYPEYRESQKSAVDITSKGEAIGITVLSPDEIDARILGILARLAEANAGGGQGGITELVAGAAETTSPAGH